MNLKEYALEKGISLDEAKKLTGLTHWKQEVVQTITIETESKQEELPKVEVKAELAVSKEYIIGSLRGLGSKSPYWSIRETLEWNGKHTRNK